MTLQETKDKVARESGFKDWKTLSIKTKSSLIYYYERVIELYSKAKWNEACEAQKEIIEHIEIDDVNAIKNAPKPDFKP